MSPLRVIRAGATYAWPSGSYQVHALLRVSPPELALRIGAPLEGGVEDGLGPYAGCGLELPSGAKVEVIAYEGGLGPETFELRVDATAKGRAVAIECIAALKLPASAIDWLPGAAI